MFIQTKGLETEIEHAQISFVGLKASRVALGTWAMGGWMWGGTDESEAIATIRAAIDHGVDLIDTAPAYGFGRSEEIIGKALAESGLRSRVAVATKVGLEWDGGKVFRNASRVRILNEVDESLRRLRTDRIDIYQAHWPDPLTPIEETAEAMHSLFAQGKIRAIGVSNFSAEQMERFRRVAPLHVLQAPYNLFERDIEPDILPFCRRNNIATLGYGALCRDFYRAGCGRTLSLRATIFAAQTQNSNSRDSGNIWRPWISWINWRVRGLASGFSISPCVGCSTRASAWRFGVRGAPAKLKRSTRLLAGGSTCPPRWKLIASYPRPSALRSGLNSWRRPLAKWQRERPDRRSLVSAVTARREEVVQRCVAPSTGNVGEQRRRIAMVKALIILLVPLIGLVALGAQAAGGTSLTGTEIAHRGNGDGAPACTSCHGEHFQGEPTLKAPALAGLPTAFILSRLAHYAGPNGRNPLMRQVATALGPKEREAVADYLSSLPSAR
jgi:aryl-alcohol dehydrogenase-like predicted oxidoreductase/cytochrome c553